MTVNDDDLTTSFFFFTLDEIILRPVATKKHHIFLERVYNELFYICSFCTKMNFCHPT